MSEQASIRLDQHVACPPERVWQGLTDSSLIGTWWGPGDIRPVVGHRFTLDMGGAFGAQQCEVLEVEPERRFSYTFAEGFLNTVITWTLEPEAEGTLLHFEQSGFDMGSEMGQRGFQGMKAGWPKILSGMESALGCTEAE